MTNTTRTVPVDDQTHMYGSREFDAATLEEAIYLTNTAIALAQTDRAASVWITREALDLIERVCPSL